MMHNHFIAEKGPGALAASGDQDLPHAAYSPCVVWQLLEAVPERDVLLGKLNRHGR